MKTKLTDLQKVYLQSLINDGPQALGSHVPQVKRTFDALVAKGIAGIRQQVINRKVLQLRFLHQAVFRVRATTLSYIRSRIWSTARWTSITASGGSAASRSR